jgi:hypothetical protein
VEDEDNADYILQYVASFGDQMPNQGELQDSCGKNLGGFNLIYILDPKTNIL